VYAAARQCDVVCLPRWGDPICDDALGDLACLKSAAEFMTKYLKAPTCLINLDDIWTVQQVTYRMSWGRTGWALRVHYSDMYVPLEFGSDRGLMLKTFELIAERLESEML
jgi:hypothetical protein